MFPASIRSSKCAGRSERIWLVLKDRLNICSGTPISVRELAEKVADEYGRRDLLVFGARPNSVIEPSRIVGIRNW